MKDPLPRWLRPGFVLLLLAILLLANCATGGSGGAWSRMNLHPRLLPPNVHGRLIARTMQPQYITIHSTENPGGTAEMHARYLLGSGKTSQNNPRFGRSGWVTWHYTVDDLEVTQHLLPTEQGDHADYGGLGDTRSIGVEICEFRDPQRQAAAIQRAALLTATLANQFHIPQDHIVPHKHWLRWDYPTTGKPCPRILLERDPAAPGGVRIGAKWEGFLAMVRRAR